MAAFKRNSKLDLGSVGKKRFNFSNTSNGPSFKNKKKYSTARDVKNSSKKAPKSQLSFSNQGRGFAGLSSRTLRIIRIVIFLLIAILISLGVGYLVYQISTQSNLKPAISEEDVSKVLEEADKSNKTQWSAFFITDATVADAPNSQLSRLAMMCTDSENKRITVLYIPVNTIITSDEKNKRTAKDLFSVAKETAVIDALNELSNITISHYFEASQLGFNQYVQNSVGLTVDYGSATLINRQLIAKICGSSTEQMPNRVTEFKKYFACDYDDKTLLAFFKQFQGLDVNTSLDFASMPTTQNPNDTKTTNWPDNVIYNCDKEAWQTMVYRSANAKTPVASENEILNDNRLRRATTVCIWNGTGVSGAAADLKKYLVGLGWNVVETGNAASFVYDETLIVYPDGKDNSAAHLVVSDMKQGRCVRSGFRYSFTTDVLVVVGKDFVPY